MDQSIEKWLPVVGGEGAYEVSDRGRVRSVDRVRVFANGHQRHYRGRMLTPSPGERGHLYVQIFRTAKLIHRLVLEAFEGPCPEGMEGCHHDGNPTNNRIENLRWDTRRSNVADALRHGTHSNGQSDKTCCPRGHMLSGPNLYRYGNSRACKACRLANTYAWRHAEPFSEVVADRYYRTITG